MLMVSSYCFSLKVAVISFASSTDTSMGLSVESIAPLQPENTHSSLGVAVSLMVVPELYSVVEVEP